MLVFCRSCGKRISDRAGVCPFCGSVRSGGSRSAQPPLTAARPRPLWNPAAACNWSLVFSPAFGAYLHALNWDDLNEPAKARTSMAWFFVALAMAGAAPMLLLTGVPPQAVQGLLFAFLLGWYFGAARRQIKYVKEKYGKTYSRRPWGKTLSIATTLYVAYLVFVFVAIVVAVAFGLLGRP